LGEGYRERRVVLVGVQVGVLLALWQVLAGAGELAIVATTLPEEPVIDGVLDDPAWSSASAVEDLVQFEPEFGAPSPFATVVLVGYTEDALFVAFRCLDPSPEMLSAAVTSRDGELADDDTVSVLLDTFNDGRRAYFFATNLLGVQLDGKVADNGRTVDVEWDASWSCASRRSEQGWTSEIAIPFEILRYRGGRSMTWGINFHRHVPRRLETSVWSGPAESEWRVSSFRKLYGLDLRRRSAKRYEVIPYGIWSYEEGEGGEVDAGVDLRVRIGSGLGADLTINPDFALVEADVEEINLSRFELFVPEKRPFFLEGVEMFDQRIRQFYSRRIGDISWGGKLSGKVGGWDVATLATRADLHGEDAPGEETDSDTADYAVMRLQRGVFGPSTIGFLAANRNTREGNTGSVGLDATLYFSDTLGMTAQFLRSHGPANDGTLGWFVRPAYDSANSHFHVRYTHLDAGLEDNINAVGFLEDDDRREFDTNLEHTFWFSGSAVEKLKGEVNYNRYWSREGVLRSWELEADAELVLTSHWEVGLSYDEEFELFEKEFRNSICEAEIGHDNRAGRSFKLSAGVGENYDSDLRLFGFETELSLSEGWDLSYELTRLELDPDPEHETTWIHVFRTSYHFTNDLYLRLFAQTNSVIDKENVQVLLVWRFLPPFGSLQVAYQRGTSEMGARSEQGDSVFTKLSWVF
jgi:hypothetical protein